MDVKVITPVGGASKSTPISKNPQDRQGGDRGRRQQSPDSYKIRPESEEVKGFDKFFATTAQKPDIKLSDFERLLKKVWEDNARMQESAKIIEQAATPDTPPIDSAWVWGMSGGFRRIIKK